MLFIIHELVDKYQSDHKNEAIDADRMKRANSNLNKHRHK